ncbi:MAG: DUF4230 domain-containing protein [Cyanothece sp. SIO1E1]|nr:DUF4230 domain-containing protein [Cyanothece sp. SIO1E1]
MSSESYKPYRLPLKLFKNFLLVTVGGTALVGLLALVGISQAGDRFLAGLKVMLLPPPPEPKVDIPALIVKQIRNASELTTAVFAMEAVVPTSQDRILGNYVIGRTTLLYIAYGEVRAGVDLSELQVENVQVDDQAIQVQLPPPEILDSKIDVNRSRVYDYDRGFLNLGPDTAPELQTLAQQETLQKIVASACAEGLLNEANARAELVITQLIKTTGYHNISIQTQSAAAETCS